MFVGRRDAACGGTGAGAGGTGASGAELIAGVGAVGRLQLRPEVAPAMTAIATTMNVFMVRMLSLLIPSLASGRRHRAECRAEEERFPEVALRVAEIRRHSEPLAERVVPIGA